MKTRWLITAITLGISSFGLGINDAKAVLLTHGSQCFGIDKVGAGETPGTGAPTVLEPTFGQVIHLDTNTNGTGTATLICPVS